MTFLDSVRDLFTNYTAPPGAPRVEIKIGYWSWRAIPLEWNQAKALSAIFGEPVRMVSAAGLVMRRHDPSSPETREGA